MLLKSGLFFFEDEMKAGSRQREKRGGKEGGREMGEDEISEILAKQKSCGKALEAKKIPIRISAHVIFPFVSMVRGFGFSAFN